MKQTALRILLPVILLLVVWHKGTAQSVFGTIKDKQDEPIPFASVYVPSLQKGTTANLSGEYRLNLPEGEHELVFQYLGYKTVTHKVLVGPQDVELHVTLTVQHYNLAEVIVTASGEDPAYYIMRKAISLSGYYLKQVSEYKAGVYLKGTGVALKIPMLLRRQMKEDGIEVGKYFVTETISKIHYKTGEPLKTEVISTRSAGFEEQADPMQFVALSLYQDISGIISPLSRNAFTVYRFKLEGSFVENGHTINKIRVIPRRKGQDLYSGTIFIREGGWNLHSVDLKVEQNMFSINIRQLFQEVKPMVWMPVSHDYDVHVEAMGAEAKFRYLVTVSDYEISMNPTLDHAFYARLVQEEQLPEEIQEPEIKTVTNKEPAAESARQQQIQALLAEEELSNKQARELNRLVRMETNANRVKPSLEVKPRNTEISDSARTRSSDYWQQFRPVPLTLEEQASFGEKTADTAKTDTTARKMPWLNDLVFGESKIKLNSRWTMGYNGLISPSGLSFNTVDGFLYEQKFTFQNDGPSGRRFRTGVDMSYAFARQRPGGKIHANWQYDPFRRASVGIEGGRKSADFSSAGIHPLMNSITSLFNRQNYMKLYEKDYVKLTHTTDLVNGLTLGVSAEYARRRQLENQTDFFLASITGQRYTPNLPEAIAGQPALAAGHRAMLLGANLSYTPRHFYRLEGRRKTMLYSRYPTFGLRWQQAVPGFDGSTAEFGLLEASVKQGFELRLAGNFSYSVAAGMFTDTTALFFADYKHFATDPLWIGISGRQGFRGLGFYERSTNAAYLQAHLDYSHSRILLKRLPFLAGSLIRESLSAAVLLQEGRQPYVEAAYGLNQLFLLFTAEVYTSFMGGRHHHSGIRIGIPLGGGEVRL